MDDAKQQLIDKLKAANNVLVTVSRNPSVDQLASCIGLTLLLNKQGKHAAAVFSGKVPSTLEFLKPGDTLEKNTDSLRDFIIALDKSKADKLRYKVEDNVVRIFITPYKTSLSEADLEFSEGDFNVDVVVALGVHRQEDLDESITAHGRILHDATVASINITPEEGLGTINWYDPQTSSLSELVTELTEVMGGDLLDNQIATALLTGIVSETERFSNDKTSSQTMSASAALMAAGANQQLVASKLQEGFKLRQYGQQSAGGDDQSADEISEDDGMIQIDHNDNTDENPEPSLPAPDNGGPPAGPPSTETPGVSGTGNSTTPPPLPSPTTPGMPDNLITNVSSGAKLVTEPPTLGGTLTANSREEGLESTSDPFSLPTSEPPQLLDRKPGAFPGSAAAPVIPSSGTTTPVSSSWPPPSPLTPPAQTQAQAGDENDRTLTELEKSVGSPHVASENLDEARDEVSRALTDTTSTAPPEPIQALNAQPIGGDLHPDPAASPPPTTSSPTTPTNSTPPEPITPTGHPRTDLIPPFGPTPASSSIADPTAPPPVPPPIPFQFGNSGSPPT